jgi:hypothetical protein
MPVQIEDGARVRICSSGWQVPTWAIGTEGVVDRQTRSGNFVVRLDEVEAGRPSQLSAKPAQIELLTSARIGTIVRHYEDANAVDDAEPDSAARSTAPHSYMGLQIVSQETPANRISSPGTHRQRTPTQRFALLLATLLSTGGLLWAIVPYSTEMPALGRQQKCQDWGGAISQVRDDDEARATLNDLEESNATLADEVLTDYLRAAMDVCQEAATSRLRLSAIAIAGGIIMVIGILALGGGSTPSSDSSGKDDPIEQIRRLAELREARAITDEEFEVRKRALLRHLE